MKNEVVSFDQAVVLNELKYDGDYNYTYTIDKHLWYGDVKADGVSTLAAPLKQQAFRWFQNKYNWYHTMDFRRKAYPSTNQYKWKIDIGLGDVFFIGWADTYEEAENACIDKLIEIAKQQDNES
jgi:hypothetical protein